ncbi:2-hydroxyhepta-2,4-diene-1,7-dioate isomerase [Virgibacillus profundi]|uniref:2-hydroxyhepta-2,4-diene-1,7-dioate isomerase n=1 Tax=Virgibacillus profundi TaxID=2024555 RepID=A0A2A2I8N9_9BACI|nr:fumarylacetoacetate hydrolase family protein [Virgibacillus profundi]PAV27748.1 2-hydroxyhepta-2,4-diene-1,7-dioate isomerase [Virgibacillus profundi]PXY51903.1 FAA hydrolase family protein [Virgibacillus profundi]
MKLVSYKLRNSPGDYRIGCMFEEKVIDLQDAYRKLLLSKQEKDSNTIDHIFPASPESFYSIGSSVIAKAREAYDYIKENNEEDVFLTKEEIILDTPNPNPSKVICVGKNYADHVAEMASDIPEFPVLFAKFNNAIIGPDDAIEKSSFTKKLDYEVELAVVIGKEASHVSKEDALNYIAGYTIGNDISARDLQKRTPQWLQGKTLDRSTPIGPWVVTIDEIEDPASLSIRSYVNGEERQSSNTSHLIFDIPYLIEFISNLITLKPGDIILTGTPDGVGFAMKPPQFLKDGDVVALEIEKIGRMENRVIEG